MTEYKDIIERSEYKIFDECFDGSVMIRRRGFPFSELIVLSKEILSDAWALENYLKQPRGVLTYRKLETQ